jgi:hypothetical protein
MSTGDLRAALTLPDWRRRVFALYADVRAAADPVEAHKHWRAGRDDLFASHPQSPLSAERRASFNGLPCAPYDPAYRFLAPLREAPPEHRDVPTGTDGVVPFDRIGAIDLGPLGALDVWQLGSYGGGIFVPLRDGTAGTTTYGGGRYVLDTVKGADLGGDVEAGELVIDLNFAYHPSCTYDPMWTCPLAPAGNVLTDPVAAGEQLPAGGWY